MKKPTALLLAFMLVVCLAACGDTAAPDPEAPPTASVEQTQPPEAEITSPKGIYSAEENGLHIAMTDCIPEFSEHNDGTATYDPEADTIKVCITKSTGTHTGVLEGPTLVFTVNLSDGTVVSREYTPEPDDEGFQRAYEDDGSLESVSDERLVEIARLLREQIGKAPNGGYK